MISQALGNRAIIDGFTVYYIRTATLLEDIKLARLSGSYTNLIKKFARYKLLIIDDFGVTPISSDDTTNLFEIIEARSQVSSTIITSQLPVKDWYGYLQNNTAADAILDRIVHSSHRVEIEGESMRKITSNIDTNYE
jgi:DNA replication protein DnaC